LSRENVGVYPQERLSRSKLPSVNFLIHEAVRTLDKVQGIPDRILKQCIICLKPTCSMMITPAISGILNVTRQLEKSHVLKISEQ